MEPLEDRLMLHHGTLLPAGFTEVEIANGLEPTAMEIAFDDRIFIAEGRGTVRVVKDNHLLETPFVELNDVNNDGDGGLIGLTLDPRFHENNYVYVFYTVNDSPTEKHNRVSRFTANGDVAEPASELVLVDLEPLNDSRVHHGGALAFGADGNLYIGVGDNRIPANAQSLETRAGSLLRIQPDGTIPEDNPFFDTTTGDNRAIWALGLRNPFSMDVQPGTGRIFINDVGAGSFEEINEGIPGANYGFPAGEGPINTPPFVDPVFAYAHGPGGDEGCAISGGVFYNPPVAQFPEEFVGDYFFLDHCNAWIQRYNPADGSVTPFAEQIAGFAVDLEWDNNGSLYYLSREDRALYRIDKPGDLPPSIVLQPVDQAAALGQAVTFTASAAGSGPLTFQWQRDGVDIAGATSRELTIPEVLAGHSAAYFRVVVSNSFGTVTSQAAQLSIIPGEIPTAFISAPTAYIAGDEIHFSGSGSDAEDGALPASALTWRVDFHHGEHVHPFTPATSGLSSGSFTVPTTGEVSASVWFRIHLTAEDSDGLTHTTFHDVFPVTSLMSFTSNLPGVRITLDSQPLDLPAAILGVVNASRELAAPAPQTIGDDVYQFLSWSDAGDRGHTISTPAVNTTYEAVFGARRIDPLDAGYAEAGSGWQAGPAPGHSGTTRVSSDPAASATWTPTVRRGFHHVSIYREPNPENTGNAVITVLHNQRTDVRTLDLSSGETGWVYLGAFFFDGTGNEHVTIRNGAASGDLVADSVEFHNGDGLDEGLVAYLSYDEGRGSVASDASPHGRDNSGLLQDGAAWSPGGLNGAVDLDGVRSTVEIPNTPDINQIVLDKLTIATWFRVEDASILDRKQLIYEHGGESRGLNIYVHDGNLHVGAWNDRIEGWTETFLSTDAIESGSWHHVALVLDGSDTPQPQALTGYLDGVAFGSGEAARSEFHGGGIGVGRDNGQTRFHDEVPAGNRSGFAGQIDETRVFQRALSDREVEFLAGEFARQFTVNSILDSPDNNPGDGICSDASGSCTLRAAIQEANAAPNLFGPDVTLFDIPGTTIQLQTPLPQIVEPLVIDATSQPGFAGVPIVELDGTLAGAGASGIVVTAGGSTIRGFAVTGFAGSGIVLAQGGGNKVQQNLIGTNSAGTAGLGNGSHGVIIFNSSGNLIGGLQAHEGNVISGNGGHGVFISRVGSSDNVLQSNIIGLGPEGSVPHGNSGVGVRIDRGAHGNLIGNAGVGNVISGNVASGVFIGGTSTANNTLASNKIGTDTTGTLDRGNGASGVSIDNAPDNHIGMPGDGNLISGNQTDGVFISGASATTNSVRGNRVGLDVTGTTALPNQSGVTVNAASNNTIGGTTAGEGNVISGNDRNGIFIAGGSASENKIEGNLIGTDLAGTSPVPNGLYGVALRGAPSNTVGGTASGAGNVISGNLQDGVAILYPAATANIVVGNLIGTDITGTADVGNGVSGVSIWKAPGNRVGGLTAAERNILSGNNLYGVRVLTSLASGNVIQGNYIGTDVTGTTALANEEKGVYLVNARNSMIGGSEAGARNLISGNNNHGVTLTGAGAAGNQIQGNFIGLDVSGTVAIGNLNAGVRIAAGAHDNTIGGANAGEGNTISGNGRDGLLIVNLGTRNITVLGNRIGTDVTGTVDVGNGRSGVSIAEADTITIGGVTVGMGNVISGNDQFGVVISGASATDNSIQGNSIGADITGTADLGNASTGVLLTAPGNTIGGTVAGAGNLISGNDFLGVRISGASATGNSVEGNLIGTQIDGVSALGNTSQGVRVDGASNNAIGGTAPDAGNVIAHNTSHGVAVVGTSTGNSIERNAMFSNGGLGIDLGLNGVTANDTSAGSEDADSGPNNLQNTPVISVATLTGTDLDITYSVRSNVAHSAYPLSVEFFIANAAAQEGETFLDAHTYTVAMALGSEAVTIDVTGLGVSGSSKIVATATDSAGNTSEFSAPFAVSLPLPDAADLSNQELAAGASPDPPQESQACAASTVALQDSNQRQEQYTSCDTANASGMDEQSDIDPTEPGDSNLVWQNPAGQMDVNNDGFVSPVDVLATINELNSGENTGANGRLPNARAANLPFLDVSGDGFATPIDALLIIDELNGRPSSEGESSPAEDSAIPVSIAFRGLSAVFPRFTTARQDRRSARASFQDAKADSSSNRVRAENAVRGATRALHASNTCSLEWYNDPTHEDSLESILDEIADDVWEHRLNSRR